jgi:hypothetical protein
MVSNRHFLDREKALQPVVDELLLVWHSLEIVNSLKEVGL